MCIKFAEDVHSRRFFYVAGFSVIHQVSGTLRNYVAISDYNYRKRAEFTKMNKQKFEQIFRNNVILKVIKL